MTMDKSAIEQIQQSQAIEAAATSINEALGADVGFKPIVALPNNMHILSFEDYLPGRVRYRGDMRTSVIKDLARYVKDHQSGRGAECFIDPEKMAAKVIFNLGTLESPGHGDFTATLQLDKTTELRELTKVDGQKVNQKFMGEWFEDWKDYIQFYSGEGDHVDAKTAISAVRRLTIESHRKEDHEVSDFRAQRSALESIEAKSDHGMPAGFRFTCVPYKGLPEHTFDCRISIVTGDDAPGFIIRVRQFELEMEIISDRFMDILEGKLAGTDVDIYRGNLTL